MAKVPKVALKFDQFTVYGVKLLCGIVRYSHDHGPWIFYRNIGTDSFLEPTHTQMRRHFTWLKDEWGADGLILSKGCLTQDRTLLKRIIKSGLPTIIHDPGDDQISSFPTIRTNDTKIGKIAAEHLLDRGFRNFAFCGLKQLAWSQDRRKSYSERLAQAGFEDSFYDWPEWPNLRSSKDERAFHEWLKSLRLPVAVMGANDACAREVIEACKNINLRVPEDVAVVGVDNDDMFGNKSYPPLSSVNVDNETAGYQAAELLDKLMAGKNCPNKSIVAEPTHVIARGSTDTLAVEDPEVAQAMRFIRENVLRPLQVTAVADAAGLSCRSLQYRFQNILGRSVLKEIKRARIDKIKQMLLETDFLVSNIAIKMGYDDANHLARYFHSAIGITPSAYRKKNTLK